MRILFVSPRQCLPAVSGAKLRDYHLAKALGKRASLDYVFYSARGRQPLTKDDLPFCHEVAASAPARTYTAGKIVRGLVGRWPLSVYNYTSPEMHATLTGIVTGVEFDLVHFDSIHLAAYERFLRKWLPKARIIYDWHNIESDIMRQYSASSTSHSKKVYSALTARKLTNLERRILRTAFGHIVCSARERDKLLAIAPQARIEVIENGVDTARFSRPPRPEGERNRIVFVGLMNYHANVEAAVWFAKEIWPAIHRRFPQWRLTLVGADPAAAVVDLRNEKGIEVTGTVPEVAPYYDDAFAAVVPLRSGGGTRLKILEAMAAGVPVVSTPIGAEGLEISAGRNILLAPDAGSGYVDQWIRALEILALDAPRRGALIAGGHTLAETRYDWEVIGQRVYDLYSRWLAIPL